MSSGSTDEVFRRFPPREQLDLPGIRPTASIVIEGDEATAYLALQNAACEAMAAQAAQANAKSKLHAAIEAMCRLMAPAA